MSNLVQKEDKIKRDWYLIKNAWYRCITINHSRYVNDSLIKSHTLPDYYYINGVYYHCVTTVGGDRYLNGVKQIF